MVSGIWETGLENPLGREPCQNSFMIKWPLYSQPHLPSCNGVWGMQTQVSSVLTQLGLQERLPIKSADAGFVASYYPTTSRLACDTFFIFQESLLSIS